METVVDMILSAELNYGNVELILSPRSETVRTMLESQGRKDLANLTQESDNDKLYVTCSGTVWTWGGFDLRYV